MRSSRLCLLLYVLLTTAAPSAVAADTEDEQRARRAFQAPFEERRRAHMKALAAARNSKSALIIDAARVAWLRALELEDARCVQALAHAAQKPLIEQQRGRARLLRLRLLIDMGRREEAKLIASLLEEQPATLGGARRLLVLDARGQAPEAAASLFDRFLARGTLAIPCRERPDWSIAVARGRPTLLWLTPPRHPLALEGLDDARRVLNGQATVTILLLGIPNAPVPAGSSVLTVVEPAALCAQLGLGPLPLRLFLDARGRVLAVDPALAELATLLEQKP